ncbi:MAG: carboxypeptidase regulatory-like domain-containing protein [Planctomycetes bacterium]|nr:carboxypeptidase regulatory-like domain-containing protein [Planctomycetota bacterium]
MSYLPIQVRRLCGRSFHLQNLVMLATPMFVLWCSGCGGGSTSTVTGKVKLDGKIVPAGTVTFMNEQHKSVQSSVIGSDGTYSISIAPGNCKITVMVPKAGEMGGGMKMDPAKMGAGGKVAAKGTEAVDVPPKYRDMKTTPLTVNVEAGQKTHDIDMKAEAKTD